MENQLNHINDKKGSRGFLVTYGIIIFVFSITLLTQKDLDANAILIARVSVFLSAALGICALLPWDLKFYSNKWFVMLFGTLAYIAWFFGFVMEWIEGITSLEGFWQSAISSIGLLWMWIILLLLTRMYVIVFEKYNKTVKWIAPMIIPALLLWVNVSTFIEGDYITGLILEAFTIGSFHIALRVWKPIGSLDLHPPN